MPPPNVYLYAKVIFPSTPFIPSDDWQNLKGRNAPGGLHYSFGLKGNYARNMDVGRKQKIPKSDLNNSKSPTTEKSFSYKDISVSSETGENDRKASSSEPAETDAWISPKRGDKLAQKGSIDEGTKTVINKIEEEERCSSCDNKFVLLFSHLSRSKKCQKGYDMNKLREDNKIKRREYKTSHVKNKRNEKRTTDDVGFKADIASEKAKERTAKRKADEIGFKAVPASEKAGQRTAKRKTDEIGFKAVRASEKAGERTAKRKADQIGLKAGWASEKAAQRTAKRKADDIGYKSEIAAEKSKQRKQEKDIKMKSEIGRRRMFFEAVRPGPIYGCVCCHRIRFRKGVVEYDSALRDRISQKDSDILNKAVGIPKNELLVKKKFLNLHRL
jgi:hypothetical protein